MSWDDYVDRLELTGCLVGAAIIGSDGTVLTTTDTLTLLEHEGERLLEGFRDPECGVTLSGTLFLTILQANKHFIHAKKNGAGGVVCIKCNKVTLIGFYNEPQAIEAVRTVQRFADGLIAEGY